MEELRPGGERRDVTPDGPGLGLDFEQTRDDVLARGLTDGPRVRAQALDFGVALVQNRLPAEAVSLRGVAPARERERFGDERALLFG